MCCCRGHDDRTPSLSVTLGRKAILFHCFAGCSNEEVIAALDRQGVRSCDLFDSSGAVADDPQEKRAFNSNARRLWHSATAIPGSPAEVYLAQRGILRASDQLRYLERTPLGPRGAVQFLPAMLAAVTTDIGIIAVHRTFLDTSSGKLAGFERPKRALGSLGCGAVRLAPPAAGRLGLGVLRLVLCERHGGIAHFRYSAKIPPKYPHTKFGCMWKAMDACGRESPATLYFFSDFRMNSEASGSFRKGLW
jgi:putative DNA primase/helicase